jgi:DNA-binding MarR family transcriptional regulator
VSATKLVLALAVTQADVTRCTVRLAPQHQVEVNRDEKDQRSRMVSLSAAGNALVQSGKRSCGPMWSRPCGVSVADCRALCLCSWGSWQMSWRLHHFI